MYIGIIGCGVAGMASAIALARSGHDVEIYERFSEPKPVGAGLLLQPSGLAVLDRLSLADDARRWGAPVEHLHGRTVSGRTVMNLRYADVGAGVCGLGIHRGALFDVLHDAVRASGARLHFESHVSGIEDVDRPRLIHFDGRQTGPFDLVLDCAGSHNSVCAKLGLRSREVPYDWCALWAICPDRSNAFQRQLRQVYHRASLMIGILPVGRTPHSEFEGNHVALFWSLKRSDADSQRLDGLARLKDRICAAWPEAAPIVEEIDDYGQLSLATYRDVGMHRFHRGRVLALGDAAHATSPQLGQGANLALIDAITLAHAMRAYQNLDAALLLYERMRRSHVRFYQIASRVLTPLFQSDHRFTPALRDIFFDPLGRLPLSRHVMRTTLSGVRRFPWGTWKPPA
ncbi:MAG: NAD(P)/FAD-dependent oxidoreductase [Rhizomicrobium sp.]|jgi:2-polyprenyl-6-methoxyphenol hydroxylase-like FAD-dependent oxidoreductase